MEFPHQALLTLHLERNQFIFLLLITPHREIHSHGERPYSVVVGQFEQSKLVVTCHLISVTSNFES